MLNKALTIDVLRVIAETSTLALAAEVCRLWPDSWLVRRCKEQADMKLSRLKERLSHGADVCQITQQKIVALENAPEDRKRLRQFPTVEAALCSLVCLKAI